MTTDCLHRGPFDTGSLICTRPAGHAPGHVYEASAGPDLTSATEARGDE